MTVSQSEPAADSQSRESQRYARYVLFVLFVVYIFNFIDRQILSILIDPIKEDLGVSDTAMGYSLLIATSSKMVAIALFLLAARWLIEDLKAKDRLGAG